MLKTIQALRDQIAEIEARLEARPSSDLDARLATLTAEMEALKARLTHPAEAPAPGASAPATSPARRRFPWAVAAVLLALVAALALLPIAAFALEVDLQGRVPMISWTPGAQPIDRQELRCVRQSTYMVVTAYPDPALAAYPLYRVAPFEDDYICVLSVFAGDVRADSDPLRITKTPWGVIEHRCE